MKHWTRRIAALAVGLSLALGSAPRAVAQEDPNAAPAEGEGSGRPWDGYIATALFAFLAMFLVGKSARR
jgi:hypothetical protein